MHGDAVATGGGSSQWSLKATSGGGGRSTGGGGNSRSARVGWTDLDGLAVRKLELFGARKVRRPIPSVLVFRIPTARLRGEFGG